MQPADSAELIPEMYCGKTDPITGRNNIMILEASAVEKWYLRSKGGSNRIYALKKADLVLKPGTMTVLTGRSGSGKTTLMNILAGLLRPDGGNVKIGEKDMYSLNDDTLSGIRSQHFGMIPQGGEVLAALTGMENILLPQGISRAGRGDKKKSPLSDVEERASMLMEKAGILSLANVPAGEVSGGERRRICVVRALAGQPDFIFADEPTSDLDDANMQIVLQMLRQSADEGASVFVVTHDRETLSFADNRFRMDDGVLYPA